MKKSVACGGKTKLMDQSTGFKILSDPNRVEILKFLQRSSHSVGEIVEHLAVERTLVSHHLKMLRESHLIVSKKIGRNVVFSLAKTLRFSGARNSMDFGCCVINFQDSESVT